MGFWTFCVTKGTFINNLSSVLDYCLFTYYLYKSKIKILIFVSLYAVTETVVKVYESRQLCKYKIGPLLFQYVQ